MLKLTSVSLAADIAYAEEKQEERATRRPKIIKNGSSIRNGKHDRCASKEAMVKRTHGLKRKSRGNARNMVRKPCENEGYSIQRGSLGF